MVDRLLLAVVLTVAVAHTASAQTLPAEELQVDLSTYLDSFDVVVVYPGISLTRQVSPSTALTGRVLVDMISAASIKSTSAVDVVSSASGRTRPVFDDTRTELDAGITQVLLGNLLSLNAIYSTERDYESKTLAGTISREFAQKNTTLQLGFVRTWDDVSPVTKDWTRHKRVGTYSASLSQILGKRALLQLLGSYTRNTGYLADAYKQVTIMMMDGLQSFDPVHPHTRTRRAAAARFKVRLDRRSALQLGYRFYWDDWQVQSHTASVEYKRHVASYMVFGAGLRSYLQSRASFFKPEYTSPEDLMTADIKLDSGTSNELQIDLAVDGGQAQDYLPLLTDPKIQYDFGLGIYRRRTDSAYWFNNSRELYAVNVSVGVRYRY